MPTEAQIECRIRRVNNAVLFQVNGQGVGMSWDKALELAGAIRRVGEACQQYALAADFTKTTSDRETISSEVTIIATGPALIFELQGRHWFGCNYRQAPALSQGLTAVARQIEEEVKHQQLAEDEALLLRTGLPVGLAMNPKIKREALKLAEDVRFPGMVEPTEVFYPPTLIQHSPQAQE